MMQKIFSKFFWLFFSEIRFLHMLYMRLLVYRERQFRQKLQIEVYWMLSCLINYSYMKFAFKMDNTWENSIFFQMLTKWRDDFWIVCWDQPCFLNSIWYCRTYRNCKNVKDFFFNMRTMLFSRTVFWNSFASSILDTNFGQRVVKNISKDSELVFHSLQYVLFLEERLHWFLIRVWGPINKPTSRHSIPPTCFKLSTTSHELKNSILIFPYKRLGMIQKRVFFWSEMYQIQISGI